MSKHSQLQQYARLWQKILREGIKLPEYKLLAESRYANPHGYQKFETIAQAIAAHIYNSYQLPWELIKNDFTQYNAITLSIQIAQAQAPVYWISQPLLESFLHTDLPNWICGMKRPVHLGILMLPRGMVLSPDGEAIDYIAFRHSLAGESPPANHLKDRRVVTQATNYDYITSTATTATGTTYVSSIELKMTEAGELDPGKSHFDTYDLLGVEVDENAETKFLKLIDSIVIQTLLVMQIHPGIITCSQVQPSAGLGFGKAQLPRQQLRSPNWIGKDYIVPKQTQTSATKTGTHASLRPHYRRGHYRRVVVGDRASSKREWRWIEPTYINATFAKM